MSVKPGAYIDVSITGGAQWRLLDEGNPDYAFVDGWVLSTLGIGIPKTQKRLNIYGHLVYPVEWLPCWERLVCTRSPWLALLSRFTVPAAWLWDEFQYRCRQTARIWFTNGRH